MLRTILVVLFAFLTSTIITAAEWTLTASDLLKTGKTGFGVMPGVAVDHANGHVFINVSDRGIFRSTDQGKTWEQFGDPFKGRTETPGCLMLDPTGKTKRLVMASVYGGPIAINDRDDKGWRFLDKKSNHVDWCAVDWSDPAMRFILTLKHESGGVLLMSRDGGQNFSEVEGKRYGPAWIFDADTAVVSVPKGKDRPAGAIVRTTDGGKTFQPSGDFEATALPRWHAGNLYWITDKALIRTADNGANWTKVCDLKDGYFGPVPGKSDKHLFLIVKAGVVESEDGGATWSKPLPPPPDFKGISRLTWLDYDPVHDVLYLTKMGSEVFKLERGK